MRRTQAASGPDTTAAVEEMKSKLKIYPLNAAGNSSAPPALQYFNMSPKSIDRIPPEGLAYFQRLAEVVTSEPLTQTDAFVLGLMKSLGMEPGKPFKPDARMTKIFECAAETGQAMSRKIAFHGNAPEYRHWPIASTPKRSWGEALPSSRTATSITTRGSRSSTWRAAPAS